MVEQNNCDLRNILLFEICFQKKASQLNWIKLKSFYLSLWAGLLCKFNLSKFSIAKNWSYWLEAFLKFGYHGFVFLPNLAE